MTPSQPFEWRILSPSHAVRPSRWWRLLEAGTASSVDRPARTSALDEVIQWANSQPKDTAQGWVFAGLSGPGWKWKCYSPRRMNWKPIWDVWLRPLKTTGTLPYDVIAVAVPLNLLKPYW